MITTRRGKINKITVDAKVETIYNTRTFTPDFVDGITYANLANEARRTRNLEPIYSGNELKNSHTRTKTPIYYRMWNWMDTLLKNGAMSYSGEH